VSPNCKGGDGSLPKRNATSWFFFKKEWSGTR
jgi:hypothetical protein